MAASSRAMAKPPVSAPGKMSLDEAGRLAASTLLVLGDLVRQ
jgi:hypothetical protein